MAEVFAQKLGQFFLLHADAFHFGMRFGEGVFGGLRGEGKGKVGFFWASDAENPWLLGAFPANKEAD